MLLTGWGTINNIMDSSDMIKRATTWFPIVARVYSCPINFTAQG